MLMSGESPAEVEGESDHLSGRWPRRAFPDLKGTIGAERGYVEDISTPRQP